MLFLTYFQSANGVMLLNNIKYCEYIDCFMASFHLKYCVNAGK